MVTCRVTTLKSWIVASCLVGLFCRGPVSGDGGDDWNYDTSSHEGPNYWYVNYPSCGANRQSPINIDTRSAWYDPKLTALDMSDYDVTADVKMTLINRHGHTAEVFYKGKSLYLRGGGLPGDYELDQLHFHWGPRQKNGSEHKLNWSHYPMELHIVHHKKEIESVDKAASKPQGLSVYAVLFKLSEEDNPKLNKMLNYFDGIIESDKETQIPTFSLKEFLPATADKLFYRYDGSLTSPPCYESVIWTIAADFVPVSEKQLNRFRELHDLEDGPLLDTHRPIQKLNGRIVRTTIRSKYILSAAACCVHLRLMSLLCLVFYVFTIQY
ncbi:carbonic anhydrase-like [Biomphalaria glabrata]|uniref:Carbonic anhydrase n=1 Tax=Biomphalaria glabrata TaxID=6526 RepID=A0A9W2YJ62_BIOGL|nr:carbonic anhydrase-like [Biomphalaria glabrata]XP_055862700.1 carbonic anhydrase-like [Biomphalaria glabrata]XP_055862701.1 carbonic anhydrase-like [Biomphalaria glabrata]